MLAWDWDTKMSFCQVGWTCKSIHLFIFKLRHSQSKLHYEVQKKKKINDTTNKNNNTLETTKKKKKEKKRKETEM